MKVNKIFLIFLMVASFFMAGCSNSIQMHERMVVQAIGVDLDELGYKITIQALDFKNPAGENEPSVKLMELRGKSLFEALENAKRETGLTPMYSQNLIVVIGKNLALIGTNSFLDFFIRHYEARPNVKICVSETSASDILSIKREKGNIEAKEINELIPSSLKSDILNFVGRLKSEFSDPYCAYLRLKNESGVETLSMTGIAIFSSDKMVGIATEKVLLGVLATMGIDDLGIYNVYKENIGRVSLSIEKVKSKIKVNTDERKFYIDVKIKINALEVSPNYGVKIGKEEQNLIENQFNEEIKSICEQAIKNSFNLNSDIFRLKKIILNNNTKYFKEHKDNLNENIKKFDLVINVKSLIDVTGTEI